MPPEPGIAALVARYRTLGAADRRAVLAHMSESERAALERLRVARERSPSPAAAGPFAGYSPWLAASIAQAAAAPAGEAPITAAARAAVAAAHKATIAGARAEPAVTRFLRNLGLLPEHDPEGPPC